MEGNLDGGLLRLRGLLSRLVVLGRGLAVLVLILAVLGTLLVFIVAVLLLTLGFVVLQVERVDARRHILLGPFHGHAVQTEVTKAATNVRVGGGGLPGEFLTGQGGEFVGEGGPVGQRGQALIHGGVVGGERR